nr:MAG TPA: cysteine-rich protein [Caudoviricetes sp.]
MANSTQPRIDNLYGLKDTGVDTQPKCGVPHVQRASGGSLFGKCPKCNAKTCPHYLYCKTCGYQLRERIQSSANVVIKFPVETIIAISAEGKHNVHKPKV